MAVPMNVKPSLSPYFLSWVCVSPCTLPSSVSDGASYPCVSLLWSMTTYFLPCDSCGTNVRADLGPCLLREGPVRQFQLTFSGAICRSWSDSRSDALRTD